jgi:hypothetical protein
MTIAHPGADYCALCMVHGQLTRAIEEWPGAPICRAHVIACGGTVEDTVVDFSAARARLRASPPRFGNGRRLTSTPERS